MARFFGTQPGLWLLWLGATLYLCGVVAFLNLAGGPQRN